MLILELYGTQIACGLEGQVPTSITFFFRAPRSDVHATVTETLTRHVSLVIGEERLPSRVQH